MENAKLYSAQDIEKLKQKIATYRDTLTTLKSGNSIDDYLFMKSELNGFKMQVSHLEGVMERLNDNRSMQIEGYEQQIDNFSRQMSSLNQTVEELNQDLSIVMNQLTNDLTEKVIAPVDVQDAVYADNEAGAKNLIEETTRTKDQTSISSIHQSNRPPTYKQLQSLMARANDSQEVPSAVASPGNMDMHESYPEQQSFNKRSFPSTGSHPNQIYNGMYRNMNRVPTIHFNNVSKKQANPIMENDNLEPSLLLATSEPEKNETVTASPAAVHHVTPIVKAVHHVTPIVEEVHHVTPIVKEVHQVAPIEIATEMKRQQHKNKETISLFNFFRKKH